MSQNARDEMQRGNRVRDGRVQARDAAREAFSVRLPRLRRRALGDRGRRLPALPLPHRARVHRGGRGRTGRARRSRWRCGPRCGRCRSGPSSRSGSRAGSASGARRRAGCASRSTPETRATRPKLIRRLLVGAEAPTTADAAPVRVVAVVGSAGGIRALQTLFEALPGDLPAAAIVVIHLTSAAPSVLPAILEPLDGPARRAGGGRGDLDPSVVSGRAARGAPAAGRARTAPPGPLGARAPRAAERRRAALSLARNHRGPCTRGRPLRHRHRRRRGSRGRQAGGRHACFAQDEATSQYFGMPGAAILAGRRRRVLPLDEIAPAVVQLGATGMTRASSPDLPSSSSCSSTSATNRGFDFTGYKRPTPDAPLREADAGRRRRRLGRRTATTSRSTREEFAELFNTILINVTGFFRDPEAWEVRRERGHPAAPRANGGDGADPRSGRAGLRVGRGGRTRSRCCSPRRSARTRSASASRSTRPTSTRRRSRRRAQATLHRRSELENVPPELRERYFEPRERPASPSATTCAAASSSAGTT